MEEIFDVYDKSGKWLGTKPKSFCHIENPGVYHKPVWIWIINSNGKILVQKRASVKKFMPNKWDVPSAGHVSAGEDLKVACQRETEEELGVKVPTEKFEFLKEVLSQKVWELGQVYLLVLNKEIFDFTLQKEEVAEVKWLSPAEFKTLLYSNDFVQYDKDYKDWVYNTLQKKISKLLKKRLLIL